MRLLLLILLTATTSAHAKKASFDPRSVTTVAMIGFGGTIDIEENTTGGTAGSIGGSVKAITALADGSAATGQQQQAIDLYNTVETGLEATFGWEVMDQPALRAIEPYTVVWTQYRGQGKLADMQENFASGLKPPGIVHYQNTQRIKQTERDALIAALGVEAVLITQVGISGSDQGVSVGGLGTYRVKPQAWVRAQLFVAGEKKAVWTGMAKGKKTQSVIKGDWGFHEGDNAPIIVEAVGLAMTSFQAKFTPE